MAKKHKVQKEFIEQLKLIPIIQVSCERVGVSRNSVYRWKKEDPKFRKQMEEAITEGEALVNDMSESALLSLIKEKNWSAISFWLRHRNPKFRDKVEVTTKSEDSGELTPSQEKIVRKALQLASLIQNKDIKYENKSSKSNSGGSIQEDDSGQDSPNNSD